MNRLFQCESSAENEEWIDSARQKKVSTSEASPDENARHFIQACMEIKRTLGKAACSVVELAGHMMKAILRHLGIESNLMTGTIDGDGVRGKHVWLYIPSINQMADPMNNMVLSPEDYESRFHPKNYYGVMHWAKPLGIIGR